uniref:Uncharacterized protein n=1 Tax=Arundo donax TaxID=35708 RepID=A0A0A9GLZ6_ARUDO
MFQLIDDPGVVFAKRHWMFVVSSFCEALLMESLEFGSYLR